MPSLLTHQFQANPCHCSLRVASIVERIELGLASNLMRVLISLTAPGREMRAELKALEIWFVDHGHLDKKWRKDWEL